MSVLKGLVHKKSMFIHPADVDVLVCFFFLNKEKGVFLYTIKSDQHWAFKQKKKMKKYHRMDPYDTCSILQVRPYFILDVVHVY